ncbi:MAG: LysM peptidoglycan-binding domain-containing protein, partial [Chloroflexi bacterium]|nr:LysM peptidoglycan-binding domain-containing protein [Chloroflexota bacterium]
FAEKLLAAGIFPIVYILRHDPPPNDSPEPNPGHIGSAEEEIIRRLIRAGVRYFETNTEPDRAREWKQQAMPPDPLERAKLVALNWLFDARFILDAGGLPALPAVSAGGELNLLGALAAMGRQDILLEGVWLALHNRASNRPLNYPDDAVHRTGQLLTREQYEMGAFTEWAWWNNHLARAQTQDEINAIRTSEKNPTQTLAQDHACFREYEYYNQLAAKYLGRSIPILSTASGYIVGARADSRYPRITPALQRDGTLALFDFMQRQAPDYYFAALAGCLIESPGEEMNAWHSSFWHRTFNTGSDGSAGIPTVAVPNSNLGLHLPVIDAVQSMPNLARRLPGMQPAPPIAKTESRAINPARDEIAPRPDDPTRALVRYTIQPDDTLYKIARQFGTRAETIAQLNGMTSLNLIHAGEIILIPPRVDANQKFSAVPLPPAPETAMPARDATSSARRDEFEIDWDPRLDAVNVRVEAARVEPGKKYWRLIRAEYKSPEEAGGKHQVTFLLRDENLRPCENHKVWQGWPEDKTDATTDARGEANIPIWASYAPEKESGPYSAWVDGLASDRVAGMGLPLKRRVNFVLTWQRVSG